MAATIVQQNSGTAGSSMTATLPAATTPGNTLLIAVGTTGGGVTPPGGFVTDVSANTPGPGGRAALTRKTTAAGETSWAFTVGAYGGGWWAAEIAGLDPSPLDQTASSTGTSASPSTGTTPTTTQADEVAVAVIAASWNALPSFASWTNSFAEVVDLARDDAWDTGFGVATRTLTATGTYSTGATLPGSYYWSAGIATYKIALPAGLVLRPPTNRARLVRASCF